MRLLLWCYFLFKFMLKIFILWDLSLKISFLRFILFEVFLVIIYFRFFLPWMYYFHDFFIWDFIFTTSSLIIHSFEFNFHRFCRNILDNIDIGMSMPVFINTWSWFVVMAIFGLLNLMSLIVTKFVHLFFFNVSIVYNDFV